MLRKCVHLRFCFADMILYSLVVVAVAQSFPIALAQKDLWHPKDGLPNPRLEDGVEACGHSNGVTSNICDPNNLLSAGDSMLLFTLLQYVKSNPAV